MSRSAKEFARIYHSVERVEWMRTLPCLACGRLPSVGAHTASGGTSRKADYDTIIPLCHQHHDEQHHGAKSFARKYNLSLSESAAHTQRRWLKHLENRPSLF
jgi:hypothetical protein